MFNFGVTSKYSVSIDHMAKTDHELGYVIEHM